MTQRRKRIYCDRCASPIVCCVCHTKEAQPIDDLRRRALAGTLKAVRIA